MCLWQKPSNNRLVSRSQTSSLKGKRPDHLNKHKARTPYVMLALTSTTSLACAQSPKSLSDAQVDSKHDEQLPKRGLQMPRMNTTRALPGEKYGATQPDIKMLYPPVRSVTNTCARQHLQFKDCPKGNKSVQCSARHT